MSLGVACLLLVLVLIAIFCLPYLVERWRFNKGTCRCGEKFDFREMDEQGCRRYTCDKCGYTVWVTYDSVDNDWRAGK